MKQSMVSYPTPGKADNVLALLAVAIADRPQAVARLLRKHGYAVGRMLTGKALVDQILHAITHAGPRFHHALAQLLAEIHAPDKNETQEDSFDLGALLSPAGGGQNTGNGGITVGADPVSAIAGAVGSVANLFGNKQRQQLAQQQARSQTLQTMLAYKAQQEAQAVGQVEAQQQQARLQARRETTLKIAGGVAVAGLAGWFLLKPVKGRRAATS